MNPEQKRGRIIRISLRETLCGQFRKPVQAESEIASAKGRVKPLTRLLRCATAPRVTAPHGCGSGVWYDRKVPFGPSTRPECPDLGCDAI